GSRVDRRGVVATGPGIEQVARCPDARVEAGQVLGDESRVERERRSLIGIELPAPDARRDAEYDVRRNAAGDAERCHGRRVGDVVRYRQWIVLGSDESTYRCSEHREGERHLAPRMADSSNLR